MEQPPEEVQRRLLYNKAVVPFWAALAMFLVDFMAGFPAVNGGIIGRVIYAFVLLSCGYTLITNWMAKGKRP